MKRNLVAVMLAVFVIGLFAAPQAYGAKQFLQGAINGWNAKGKVIEVRRCKDTSYDLILLDKEDTIRMYKFKSGKTIEMTPLGTYDIEKVKEIAGGAGKGLGVYMSDRQAKTTGALIFAITVRMGKDGAYEYLVHAYHPAGENYRKSWVVPTTTWEMLGEADILDDDPRETFWSKEEQEAGSVEFDAVAAIKAPAGEAAPDVDDEGEGEE